MLPLAADSLDAAQQGTLHDSVVINTLWVVFAAILVLFMQGGFAMLEIGFSRAKNAGTVVAKILTNLSIAALCYWAVGFALAFGNGTIFGTDGFFLEGYGSAREAFGAMAFSDAAIEGKWLFQFAFCAVSLAIVWGTTLERIRYGAHAAFAVVFSALIYPIVSHWVFGGGWLQSSIGMQDFAGSSAVHLTGATAGLAALLILGPRRGKYGHDGTPLAIPGHSMPLVGLGTIILFIGWFGFNAGSTLGAADVRVAPVAVITQHGGAGGVLGALITTMLLQRTVDIGMVANGMIGGLVAITAPSGYISPWPAPIIGFAAGVIVVVGVVVVERRLDDPVGVISVHGMAGIWGTLSCGLFTLPRLAQYNGVGEPDGGLFYSGSLHQLGDQALGVVAVFAFVFGASLLAFAAIRATVGMRVSEAEEEAGLDIVEHGMYGYPEQFIHLEHLANGSREVSERGLTPR
ncbi:MAG: ammonium transporter, Amt family [Thermoleophilaceae bacterium]|nr:ammonium transporter, Amt family [Thermoleophilaceae bacterium]